MRFGISYVPTLCNPSILSMFPHVIDCGNDKMSMERDPFIALLCDKLHSSKFPSSLRSDENGRLGDVVVTRQSDVVQKRQCLQMWKNLYIFLMKFLGKNSRDSSLISVS